MLHAAETSLYATESQEWLAVLEAYGPAAAGGDMTLTPMTTELCERILNNSAQYPLQWVLMAEASQSQRNTELPLVAAASTWFED